jgi:hypothetical protein
MSKHTHCECGCGARVKKRFVHGHHSRKEVTAKQLESLAEGRRIAHSTPRSAAQIAHVTEMGKKHWKTGLDVAHSMPPTAKQIAARKKNMLVAVAVASSRPRTKKQLKQIQKASEKLNRVITSKTNGVCEICANPCWIYKDHDHVTGKKRGGICRWCNLGLGCFRDHTTRLKAAVKYILKYRKRHKYKHYAN